MFRTMTNTATFALGLTLATGSLAATPEECQTTLDRFKELGNVKMRQVSVGLQLGGQAYSQLVLFQNKDSYDQFIGGNFEFGADATAVALTYGAAASAGTQGASASASGSAGPDAGIGAWKYCMAIYTLAKGGLMYQAAIGGQKYKYAPLEEKEE